MLYSGLERARMWVDVENIHSGVAVGKAGEPDARCGATTPSNCYSLATT